MTKGNPQAPAEVRAYWREHKRKQRAKLKESKENVKE